MTTSLPMGDVDVLRELAREVAEIAALPIQAERINLWKRHNALAPVRPMILVFPEGSWVELLPESALSCQDPVARRMELELRRRLFYHSNLRDDTVIEAVWDVSKAVRHTRWGLEERRFPSTAERGSWQFDPVILEPVDLKKLRLPEVIHDERATRDNLELAQEVFDGILEVRLRGVRYVHICPMEIYVKLRGLMQVMEDMYANPGMLHEAMSFFEQWYRELLRQYEEMNLLDLNNDGSYQSSGGVGYSDEIPRPGYDPGHVRPADIWASAQSQEMALVSPEQHWEFVMQYERRLLAPFALVGYGCCEDLTRKLDRVLSIPHMRRVSIAPSADVEACAERLRGDYVFSWKPQPAHLVGSFDSERVRRYIRGALEATRRFGCVVELVLKDTHTCENRPERFTRWTEIARELVEA